MLTEVDYGKSPVFMNNSELKKEIWRLKGLLEKRDIEISQLKKTLKDSTAYKERISEVQSDNYWHGKYRNLLAKYNRKLNTPLVIERHLSVQEKLTVISQFYGLPLNALTGKVRTKEIYRARCVAAYVLYNSGYSVTHIAKFLQRHHASIIYQYRHIEKDTFRLSEDEKELIKTLTK